jgi:hypothetical protein
LDRSGVILLASDLDLEVYKAVAIILPSEDLSKAARNVLNGERHNNNDIPDIKKDGPDDVFDRERQGLFSVLIRSTPQL